MKFQNEWRDPRKKWGDRFEKIPHRTIQFLNQSLQEFMTANLHDASEADNQVA